jgi:hypothetical protein
MRTLLVNRHPLPWTAGYRGDYLPAEPADRHVITRTFGDGLAGHEPEAFPNTVVLDMDDLGRVEDIARWWVAARGIERVVAIHEKDMLLAARIRQAHGLAGMDVPTTLPFRDKLLMKDMLAANGYEGLPKYRGLERGEEPRSVPWSGRSVVKSRWGVGSSQVRIVDDLAQAARAARELEGDSDELEIEEFVEGAMFHCDAAVHEGKVLFCAASEYIAAPGAYRPGAVAGSVLLEPGALRDELMRENEQVLALLGMTTGVTHVEFFRRPSGQLVFCEAAARPGGGGIDDIVFRGYGVNLVRAAIELQSGSRPLLPSGDSPPEAVVGIVGVYHALGEEDGPATGIEDEIPGVLSYHFSRPAVAGKVRHCTDYGHKIVLSADTREEFDDLADRVVRRVRGDRAGTRGRSSAAPRR